MNLRAKIPAFLITASLSLGLLSACTKIAPSPVEQVQQATKLAGKSKPVPKISRAKLQTNAKFICKNDKQVRVTYIKKNSVKNNRVTVSFNGASDTLSPTVTKNGKKYNNMRWIWWEPRNGKAVLMTSSQKVLAEGCVKQ